jgi:hypothetical protein
MPSMMMMLLYKKEGRELKEKKRKLTLIKKKPLQTKCHVRKNLPIAIANEKMPFKI